MTRGRFITLEGGEGTGKSTQARLLAATLREAGRDVVTTREPGGTTGAEAIRTLLLSPPDGGWNPRAEALLFAAARSDHVATLIEPALADGTWVVCDRFINSSRAYQGVGNALGDAAINTLHELGSGGMLPDLTILIDVPQAVAHARVSARDGADNDAIGGRDVQPIIRLSWLRLRVSQRKTRRASRAWMGRARSTPCRRGLSLPSHG